MGLNLQLQFSTWRIVEFLPDFHGFPLFPEPNYDYGKRKSKYLLADRTMSCRLSRKPIHRVACVFLSFGWIVVVLVTKILVTSQGKSKVVSVCHCLCCLPSLCKPWWWGVRFWCVYHLYSGIAVHTRFFLQSGLRFATTNKHVPMLQKENRRI